MIADSSTEPSKASIEIVSRERAGWRGSRGDDRGKIGGGFWCAGSGGAIASIGDDIAGNVFIRKMTSIAVEPAFTNATPLEDTSFELSLVRFVTSGGRAIPRRERHAITLGVWSGALDSIVARVEC